MNADGTGLRRLTRDLGLASRAAWSPDGERIGFGRMRERHWEIHVVNPDGSGRQRLTGGKWQPHWSPDGRQLAVLRGGNTDIRDGKTDIFVMNADGSGQRNLTRAAGRGERQPVWSPGPKK